MTRRPTRHQQAVDRIAGWIVGGRFAPGAFLPREDLVGVELGVSRTVVREAMRTLAAKGMVSVRRRHGTQVTGVDDWSLFDPDVVAWRLATGIDRIFVDDLIRFRLAIEPEAAALAAANPAFPDAELDAAYVRMRRAADGDGDHRAADLDFHHIIIVGSGNQFLRQLAPLIVNTLRVSFGLSVADLSVARASLPMHRAVADTILARQPDQARAALARLIRSARQDILAGLGTRIPTP